VRLHHSLGGEGEIKIDSGKERGGNLVTTRPEQGANHPGKEYTSKKFEGGLGDYNLCALGDDWDRPSEAERGRRLF